MRYAKLADPIISPRFFGQQRFTLQWHITARCDQSCKHCYMYESDTYENEVQNELDYESCVRIIEDYVATLQRWGTHGGINFTGGDPLLMDRFFDLLAFTRRYGIPVSILGNPFHLDRDTAIRLRDMGVGFYQVSLDGMESTHDRLRKEGSFAATLECLKLMKSVGLRGVVMFTLSRENADELIDVIRLVAREEVPAFDFARVVPVGNAKHLRDSMLSPFEYRSLLVKVLEEYRRLAARNCATGFGRKCHLWKLLYTELGLETYEPEDDTTIYDGCGIGNCILTILADGSVMSCRRLPVVIGKAPEEKLADIFVDSEAHNEMRDDKSMKKCGLCQLRQFCRGCPAVAYGVTNDPLGADPQCWKNTEDKYELWNTYLESRDAPREDV